MIRNIRIPCSSQAGLSEHAFRQLSARAFDKRKMFLYAHIGHDCA